MVKLDPTTKPEKTVTDNSGTGRVLYGRSVKARSAAIPSPAAKVLQGKRTTARQVRAIGGAEIRFRGITELLGVDAFDDTPMQAHRAIEAGFPAQVVVNLVHNVDFMREPGALERAIGISWRTFQRRKQDQAKRRLSSDQSGRTYKFAEILAKASTVLGSQKDAEEWLKRPAIGLEQQRPVDLLSTPAGVKLVEDYLARIELGVYA
jgi:putative toxin-antitoxin system antitoxin component (TIGR02293 family)